MDEIIKTFLLNISVMFIFMYFASVVYKHAISRLSKSVQEVSFVLFAILSGWATMYYGFQFSETVRFDLRYIVIIMAPLFIRNPRLIIMIGVGIAIARLSFGLSPAAWIGSANLIGMSVTCVIINELILRRKMPFYFRISAIIWIVNIFNVGFIATFGVIPAREYLTEIAPPTFLLSLTLCIIFVVVLRGFILEVQQKEELIRYARELELKTEELDAAKSELEKVNEHVVSTSAYKSEFLSRMSHEFRTPLNAIMALSSMLEDNEEKRLSYEEVLYAGMIHKSGEQLLSMINEVLDMAKIEAGYMEITADTFLLDELIHDLTYTFKPLADNKGIHFEIEQMSGLPVQLVTDFQRLQQILRNLLGNAIKFTNSGHVTLTIHGTDTGIAFVVKDTGIGIPQDRLEKIFEAFTQAESTTNRKFGGTGLGLTISKQFAELMGGTIDLSSEMGVGTTFTLQLPLLAATIEGRS